MKTEAGARSCSVPDAGSMAAWLGRAERLAVARAFRREYLQLGDQSIARQTTRTVPRSESRQPGRDHELAARAPHGRTAVSGHRRGGLRLTADPRDLRSNGGVL